jgi:hypothetical protein
VIEQGSVCFAVRKAPVQSIAIEGPSAQWVSPTPEGEETDGSTAGAEIALFTVDTAQILDSGERTFSLTITEPDKEPRTVQVSLEVEADLTQGVGIFFTGADGRLTRITPENAETYANEYYVRDKEAGFVREEGLSWCIDFAKVDSLFDALIWVDQYAKSGTAERFQEYRIRVEKDETILPSGLSGSGGTRGDYVCFTLWGYKQERTIVRDPFSAEHLTYNNGAYFIWVGTTERRITLRLGANITIDAQSDGTSPSPSSSGMLIEIATAGRLIMEKGSKITNYRSNAVTITSNWNGSIPQMGLFELKGGAITNCGTAIALSTAGEYSDALGYPTKPFRFHSGTLAGNGNDNLVWVGQGLDLHGKSLYTYLPYTYFAVNE